MLKDLFGTQSLSYMLRGGLEETSATHRVIADRVAGALKSSASTDFAQSLAASQGRLEGTDLQEDMAALADTQLRYEADAKLLQEAYARLRTAVRDHA